MWVWLDEAAHWAKERLAEVEREHARRLEEYFTKHPDRRG